MWRQALPPTLTTSTLLQVSTFSMLSSKLLSNKRFPCMLVAKRFSSKVDKAKINSTPSSRSKFVATFVGGIVVGALGTMVYDNHERRTLKALALAARSELDIMAQRYTEAKDEVVAAKNELSDTKSRISYLHDELTYCKACLAEARQANRTNNEEPQVGNALLEEQA